MRETQEAVLSQTKYLLIVPTAGFVSGTEQLTANGIRRIARASSLLNRDKISSVAFIGNEAKRYRQYFVQHYPFHENRIAFIDASAKMTNRDIFEARQKIDSFFFSFFQIGCDLMVVRKNAQIGIISYLWHCKRIEIVLRRLGYRDITNHESGETPLYPLAKEHFLYLITLIDPFFSWFGLPVVWLANKRS